MVNSLKTAIKQVSRGLVSVAIALELFHLTPAYPAVAPLWLTIAVIYSHIMLLSHGVEAAIAAAYAPARQRAPLPTALYVLFVGTVGLLEVLRSEPEAS